MAKRNGIPLLAALVVAAMSLPAQATVINLTASLDCSNVNPETCSSGGSGTGTGIVTFDDATNLLSWTVTWSGLSGTVTVAHFHGPAPTTGNAAPVVTISASSPSVGNQTLTAGQASELLAEMWYLNIHSSPTFGGGEIRGQVLVTTPAPLLPPVLLLVLGGAALLAVYRLRRSGSP